MRTVGGVVETDMSAKSSTLRDIVAVILAAFCALWLLGSPAVAQDYGRLLNLGSSDEAPQQSRPITLPQSGTGTSGDAGPTS